MKKNPLHARHLTDHLKEHAFQMERQDHHVNTQQCGTQVLLRKEPSRPEKLHIALHALNISLEPAFTWEIMRSRKWMGRYSLFFFN